MNAKFARFGAASALMVMILTLAACGSPAPARLQLEITSPATRYETTDPVLTVTGIVSEADATIKVNGVATPVGRDGSFSHNMDLPYGATRVAVTAEKADRNTINRTLNITRKLLLNVTEPLDKSVVTGSAITVNGTVSDPAAKIFVTGLEVPLAEDGSFTTTVPLHYRETIIRVAAILDGLEPLATLLTINRE